MKIKILALVTVSSFIYSCSSVKTESSFTSKREISSKKFAETEKYLYPYEVPVSPADVKAVSYTHLINVRLFKIQIMF